MYQVGYSGLGWQEAGAWNTEDAGPRTKTTWDLNTGHWSTEHPEDTGARPLNPGRCWFCAEKGGVMRVRERMLC